MSVLKKYDFASVCDYLKSFAQFIKEESKGDIDIITLIIHPHSDAQDEMCVMTSNSHKLESHLKNALDSVKGESNEVLLKMLKKMMKTH